MKIYSNVYKGDTVSHLWELLHWLTRLPLSLPSIPDRLHCPCPPPPPPPTSLPPPPPKKKKNPWFGLVILSISKKKNPWFGLVILSISRTSLYTPHSPSPPPPEKKIPGFGFLVKIHLLESSKLELCDLYFRSSHIWSFFYLFIFFYFWNLDYIKYYTVCWWFLGWCLFNILSLSTSSSLHQPPSDKSHTVMEYCLATEY